MAGHEQPRGWVYCLQLLVMPWRLHKNALNVMLATAAISCALSLWWMLGSFMWIISVDIAEPWGSWSGVVDDLWNAIFPSYFTAALITSAVVIFIVCTTGPNPTSRNQSITVSLSFVCLVIPFTCWLSAYFTHHFVDFVKVGPNPLQKVADLPAVSIASSCMWIPFILVLWAVNLTISLIVGGKHINAITSTYCPCGYDLRGSIAGGSTKCPECGVDIPERMLADPPSIAADA